MRFEELIEEARGAEPSPELAQRAIALIDLTTLAGDESDQAIADLCADARTNSVAAVCVYPQYLQACRAHLDGSGVELATVVNFPQGGDDISLAVETTRSALEKGASEIDLVAPYHAALDGDIGLTGEMVEEVKAVCGSNVPLKVILESGAFGGASTLTAVARAAVMAGADMLKTSTGKIERGASLEAAVLLLSVISEAEGRVGIKLSGGIRTAKDVAGYLHLIDATMGADWVGPDKVRFGASGLLGALLGR